MGLAHRLFAPAFAAESPAAPPPGPGDDFWYGPAGVLSLAGVRVTPDEALKLTVVWRCLNVLADTVASLPCKVFETVRLDWQEPGEPPRGRRAARDYWLYPILHDLPNGLQTASDFWSQLVVHRGLWGSFYAEKGPGGQLGPLDPARSEFRKPRGGAPFLRYREDDGMERAIPLANLFRTKGLSLDGLVGLRTFELLREAVGLAKAGEAYAAAIFGSNGLQRAVFTTDGNLPEDKAKQYSEEWNKKFGRGVSNAHAVAFLGNGLKPEKFGINPMESQLLESRKAQAIELCRMLGVPPHKVGILDGTSGYKTEEENLRFIIDVIAPYCRSIEQAIVRDLIPESDRARYAPKFMLQALLRGDSNARSNYYVRMIGIGAMTRNEARLLEDLDPLEGLDEPLSPLNMRQGALAPQPEETGDDREENPGGRGQAIALYPPATAVPPFPSHGEGPGVGIMPGRGESADPLVAAIAERLLRKELATLGKEAERTAKHGADAADWAGRVGKFYAGHRALIATALAVEPSRAARYCAEHEALLKVEGAAGLPVIEATGLGQLVQLKEPKR